MSSSCIRFVHFGKFRGLLRAVQPHFLRQIVFFSAFLRTNSFSIIEGYSITPRKTAQAMLHSVLSRPKYIPIDRIRKENMFLFTEC